jgi:hypothetical protein
MSLTGSPNIERILLAQNHLALDTTMKTKMKIVSVVLLSNCGKLASYISHASLAHFLLVDQSSGSKQF